MKRFVVIVLDGFGVGEMPDVDIVRPQDKGADTCRHIFEKSPDLYLPTLERLGLANITGLPLGKTQKKSAAVCGKAMLKHDGADTFFGHQEIMGTNPQRPFSERFRNHMDEAEALLTENGYKIRRYAAGSESLLIVDECVTVADNMECDPGQAINITAAIDDIAFERVLEIGRLIRTLSKVPRVIAFGGRGVHLPELLAAIETKDGYIGVNAPASGVYNRDYHCVHLGYGVDPDVQVPTILGKAGIPVFLLGKAADVVRNDYGTSVPVVETSETLAKTLQLIRKHPTGFFCANVQETDLCGHRENIGEYVRVLKAADAGIGAILKELTEGDILVVMADHGNDPTIGHPHHTREMVPLMVYRKGLEGIDLGVRETLSDVGATAADYFGQDFPENGRSFLSLLK
ncbi:MAG: phosphopentomutase [Fusobacteriaceae bacterium]|jgi:phosphopentomutase|nr:phosphopentomutase [Fusobacteriaceae bacterium]